MAVEGTKIKEMMEGKTLEKDNIKKNVRYGAECIRTGREEEGL